MCKEDIRISRKLAIQQHYEGVPTVAVPVKVMTGDVNRARMVVGLTTPNGGNTVGGISLRAGGPTGPIICTVSMNVPSLIITVEEAGPLLFGEVWATLVIDNALAISVTDLVFNQPLGEI